jgi:hypothetical protein
MLDPASALSQFDRLIELTKKNYRREWENRSLCVFCSPIQYFIAHSQREWNFKINIDTRLLSFIFHLLARDEIYINQLFVHVYNGGRDDEAKGT